MAEVAAGLADVGVALGEPGLPSCPATGWSGTWPISGCYGSGAVTVPLYQTSSPEQVGPTSWDIAEARLCFVENQGQLAKVLRRSEIDFPRLDQDHSVLADGQRH